MVRGIDYVTHFFAGLFICMFLHVPFSVSTINVNGFQKKKIKQDIILTHYANLDFDVLFLQETHPYYKYG